MLTTYSKIVWLCGLLAEIGFLYTTTPPLHADNTSTIQIAANSIFYECTEHIEVGCYSI
jgi:hypothetical protein